MNYKVNLPIFEGPMDLLLFLIKKEELNIYDIPIGTITQQYLEYLSIMEQLNLEIAGDFILMSATLMRIKAQMLLPAVAEDGEEIEDPRKELVQNLIEYQKFKDVAYDLSVKEEYQSNLFKREYFKFVPEEDVQLELEMDDVTLFKLTQAFHTVLHRKDKIDFHRIELLQYSVDEQILYLEEKINKQNKISFFSLFENFSNKLILVMTFLALLELIRRQVVKVRQSRHFNDIWVVRNSTK